MKPHYFNQDKADADDIKLGMAIAQGYVPKTCLLGGATVLLEVNRGQNPCWGCEAPREKCNGRPKQETGEREERMRDILSIIDPKKLEDVTQKELDALQLAIEAAMKYVGKLQGVHRSLTGQQYVPNVRLG